MKTALVNGKIYVERGVFQSAAAMENGIITAVGTDEEILAHAGKDARIIDCEGRTVIPGLNDSHMHLLNYGSSLLKAQLAATKGSILAECAVRDTIWGIGLSMKDPDRLDIGKWKGQNLLGYALMMVRERL